MPLHDFPRSVSATSTSKFSDCKHQSEYYTFLHLSPREKSVDLHGGGAFATALEAARVAFHINNASEEHALHVGIVALWRAYGDFECPADSTKSWQNLSHALIHYLDRWP